MCADIVFDHEHVPNLCKTLRTLIDHSPTMVCLVAMKRRVIATEALRIFLTFAVSAFEEVVQLFVGQDPNVCLLSCKRRPHKGAMPRFSLLQSCTAVAPDDSSRKRTLHIKASSRRRVTDIDAFRERWRDSIGPEETAE